MHTFSHSRPALDSPLDPLKEEHMPFRTPLSGATLARLLAALALLTVALGVTAPDRAEAQTYCNLKPWLCDPPTDPDDPADPAPQGYTREYAATDSGVLNSGDRHQQTRAVIKVNYSSTNAPVLAYIETRNRAWNTSPAPWFEFTARYRVSVYNDAGLVTMTPLRAVNVCPTWNWSGCWDRTTYSQDDLPTNLPFSQLRLGIDQFFN